MNHGILGPPAQSQYYPQEVRRENSTSQPSISQGVADILEPGMSMLEEHQVNTFISSPLPKRWSRSIASLIKSTCEFCDELISMKRSEHSQLPTYVRSSFCRAKSFKSLNTGTSWNDRRVSSTTTPSWTAHKDLTKDKISSIITKILVEKIWALAHPQRRRRKILFRFTATNFLKIFTTKLLHTWCGEMLGDQPAIVAPFSCVAAHTLEVLVLNSSFLEQRRVHSEGNDQ